MRDLAFTEPGQKADAAQIAAAETEVGQAFSKDLLDFYATINGGSPHICSYPHEDFEFVTVHEYRPLAQALQAYRSGIAKGFLTADLFPFAIDEGDNYICLGRDGTITYHVHDLWDPNLSTAENQSRAGTRIADSYAQFTESLITHDEAYGE